MKMLAHEHWHGALECAKYRVQCAVILGVLKDNRKTGCIDNYSHLGIFQLNIFICKCRFNGVKEHAVSMIISSNTQILSFTFKMNIMFRNNNKESNLVLGVCFP